MHFHYFILFSTIFMVLLIFNKHEQTSWFQIMEFIESTHAKIIWALVGARHPWYFLQYSLFDILLIVLPPYATWNYFTSIIELTLFPILAFNSLSRYAFYHHILKNFMNMHVIAFVWCHAWLSWYLFDCLIIFDKNTCCVLYFQTNLWCLLMVLEK